MAWVYILHCANGEYYTGSTTNLERRLAEHALGLGANFTRKHHPAKLVYAGVSDSIADAFAREKQIQGWSRAKKEALIAGRFDDLAALSLNARKRGGVRSVTGFCVAGPSAVGRGRPGSGTESRRAGPSAVGAPSSRLAQGPTLAGSATSSLRGTPPLPATDARGIRRS
jgi:putative endonuclease